MPQKLPSLDDLVALERRMRDQELGLDVGPPFRLSEVKRLQRRAAPLMLLVLLAWVAGVFAVSGLVRRWMVAYSDWFGLLIILYLFASMVLAAYVWARILRWFGLRCPHCKATLIYINLKNSREDPADAAEENRRCGSCQAVIIDLEA